MRDVLRCAAAGRTAIETAEELGLSEGTVWNVRGALCARLEVGTMTAAVMVAVRRGELS